MWPSAYIYNCVNLFKKNEENVRNMLILSSKNGCRINIFYTFEGGENFKTLACTSIMGWDGILSTAFSPCICSAAIIEHLFSLQLLILNVVSFSFNDGYFWV